MNRLKMVFLGLSITSSWGNGHATTYRALLRALAARGHEVLFLERDVPWYAQNRDLHELPGVQIELYDSQQTLQQRFQPIIAEADFVCVGSYVPEGIAIGRWVQATASRVTAFYDIDTPVTLSKLEEGYPEYLNREAIPCYRLYLSFTGGPTLRRLEQEFGSPMARALYCSVDPDLYYPEDTRIRWDLGYLGTYSADRQKGLDELMLEPARQWEAGRFVVAGPQYPDSIVWPTNVRHVNHLSPAQHRRFYNQQRFTLNLTRVDMRRAGYSPSVRLFEAAACGIPIITDPWEGLASIFEVGTEIIVASNTQEALDILLSMPPAERLRIGRAARQRVLKHHTARHRAAELESHVLQLLEKRSSLAQQT